MFRPSINYLASLYNFLVPRLFGFANKVDVRYKAVEGAVMLENNMGLSRHLVTLWRRGRVNTYRSATNYRGVCNSVKVGTTP